MVLCRHRDHIQIADLPQRVAGCEDCLAAGQPCLHLRICLAAFVHDLPPEALSNVNGDSGYVRVQVLTNHAALDRDKQLAVVRELTEIVARSAGDPELTERTWVLLTDAPDGGWGFNGHAHTNDELVAAARKAMLSR
jgi:phenylpyruvate tautomerase PptA (4-oxalocrotonate tautomerase family)